MRWDPEQYGQYAAERGRPFLDLLERVEADAPRHVVDLGCGPGLLTRLLAQRWPNARVEGIDSSADMIDRAERLEAAGLEFRLGDIAEWSPEADVDVVISNAALQWVPGHEALLRRWTSVLPTGSWLAWQVPGNFDSPSHVLLRELASSPAWAAKTGEVLGHHRTMRTPSDYAQLLHDAGWTADVWETTYLHVLPGVDPVLEWMRGTGLRPVTTVLDDADRARFEAEYAHLLRTAYPSSPSGTVLDFRRIFAVGHRP
jgi:trans-aconitate 2-methyltransferase